MKQSYRLFFTFGASLAAMALVAGTSLSTASAYADPEPTASPSPDPEPTGSPTTSPSPTGSPTMRKCCATIYQLQRCGDAAEPVQDPGGDATVWWQPGFDPSGSYTQRNGFRSIDTPIGSLRTYVATRTVSATETCDTEWTVAAARTDSYECTGMRTVMNKIYKSEKPIGWVAEPGHEYSCETKWNEEYWVTAYPEAEFNH